MFGYRGCQDQIPKPIDQLESSPQDLSLAILPALTLVATGLFGLEHAVLLFSELYFILYILFFECGNGHNLGASTQL